MDDETYILWQDVFDEIAAGRPGNAGCPVCGNRPLEIEEQPSGVTKISCAKCGNFLEARLRVS